MKDFYGEAGELKINISLKYQDFCVQILMWTTEMALKGDHKSRYNGLKQLTLKLISKIDTDTQHKISEIDKRISNGEELSHCCDQLEAILSKVMDEAGMLFPKWQDEGGIADDDF